PSSEGPVSAPAASPACGCGCCRGWRCREHGVHSPPGIPPRSGPRPALPWTGRPPCRSCASRPLARQLQCRRGPSRRPVSTWGAGRIPLRTPLYGLSLSAVPSKRRVRSSCSSTVSCCGCWRRQCLIRAWHLLQFLCEIPHRYVLLFRLRNLRPHPCGYDAAEYPYLLTLREQHHSHKQGKFPLRRSAVIHELRIEQVRGNRDAGIPHRKAAVYPCHVHIPLHITSVGRAYIDQRPV